MPCLTPGKNLSTRMITPWRTYPRVVSPLALEVPALETFVLSRDRRDLAVGYIHHFAPLGPSLLLYLCARSQVDQMGKRGETTQRPLKQTKTYDALNRPQSSTGGRKIWGYLETYLKNRVGTGSPAGIVLGDRHVACERRCSCV